MKKFIISTLWCLCGVLMACGTAFAQEVVIFTTTANSSDNCSGCIDQSGGLGVGPGAVAMPFYAQSMYPDNGVCWRHWRQWRRFRFYLRLVIALAPLVPGIRLANP